MSGLGVEKLAAIALRGRRRRAELGLEAIEVARLMGISGDRYRQLECSGAGMISTIERWAHALDMDPRLLAFGPPEPQLGPFPRMLWDEQHPCPSPLEVAERIEALEEAIMRRTGDVARAWLDELVELKRRTDPR